MDKKETYEKIVKKYREIIYFLLYIKSNDKTKFYELLVPTMDSIRGFKDYKKNSENNILHNDYELLNVAKPLLDMHTKIKNEAYEYYIKEVGN